MDLTTQTLLWILAGVIMMLGELLLPGLVVLFPGIAALIIGVLYATGWVATFPRALTLWFILSLFLIFTLRWLVLRFFPSDSRTESFQLDNDLVGKEVEVLQRISPDTEGRIRYRDTSWPARSNHQTMEPGEKARLIAFDNYCWEVEKLTRESG